MSVQSLSASVVNNSAWMRNETRDKMEDFLKSTLGGHSSEYGKKISGFGEFLNDEKVQKMVANYVLPPEIRVPDQESDALYKTMTHDQRHAFWELTQPYRAEQYRLGQERMAQQEFHTVPVENNSRQMPVDAARVNQAYGIPKATRPTDADQVANMEFNTAMRNGVEHMQIVDREFKSGVSSVTWEDRFRNVVESLDRAYRGMLGTAPGGSPAATEITRQYESKLEELFDCAKARATA
jgi:hypothetical protein